MSNRTSFRPFQESQNKSQADVQMMARAPKFVLKKARCVENEDKMILKRSFGGK